MRKRNIGKALAGSAGVLLVAAAGAPGAAAVTGMEDSGDVQATVRKTVLQTGSATGELASNRMYTQVTAVGSGTKSVSVPVGTTSNRNLNQFGAFPMDGDSIVFDLDVDGSVEQRTLTESDIQPIVVSVKVLLDGVEVQPADLVGASGVVDVEYTIKNTTTHSEEVTFQDAAGEDVKQTIEVADPFVGSLDVELPKGFNEITAPGATVAGNGQNGTKLGYTFVLFPPLGAPVATVGYQARISNGQMPAAEFAFLPIQPFDNSTIAGTYEAYQGGAETGATIFGAGQQIGENLLKLQAGAGQLVSGLGQLSAGAQQLNDGLANTAAPGSAQLADGADQLSAGLSELNSNVPALSEGVEQLNDGADQLNDGAQQVAEGNEKLAEGADELNANVPALAQGVSDLNSGAQQIQSGLVSLSGGLGQLADANKGMPALEAGAKQLQFGISHPVGAGGATDPGGLLQGLQALSAGLVQASTGADKLAAGLPAAKGGVDQVKTGLDAALAPAGSVDQLQAGVTGLTAYCASSADPTSCTTLGGQVSAGLTTLEGSLTTASGVLGQVSAGLATAVSGSADLAAALKTLLLPGAEKLTAGVKDTLLPGMNRLVEGITAATTAVVNQLYPGSQQLLAGATKLAGGTGQLNQKVPTLASGVSQLAAGANQLADGSAQVADGTEQLADGTEELNSKVPTLASGVEQLDAGGAKLADGANQLADGLGAAADGSGQLADGLGQAEPGAGQIEDGAGQLKEQGSDQLEASGKEAQAQYASNVAILQAQQLLGEEGAGIPFGTATGTDTVTTGAYQLQLAGVAADTENNAMKYGLGAALIAGAAGAAYAARRKLTA